MPLKVKKSGAYAVPIGVSVKLSGAYQAVQDIFCKSGGTYQNVLRSMTIRVTPTYSSGVAPLGVLFDATSSVSSVAPEAWRDAIYAFDYGDGSAVNYTYGAVQSSKNRSLGGALGGHVYETPGTYTANVYAYDGESVSHKQIVITVQDPATVYSGTNTICCSTSGNFAGAPSGSDNRTVATFQAAAALIAPGKRVLLQRVDAWTCGATTSIFSAVTNAAIGSFGAGTKATVTKSGAVSYINLGNSGISGLSVSDFTFAGGGFSAVDVDMATGYIATGVTLNNIDTSSSGGLISVQGNSYYVNAAIHKCTVSNIVGGAGRVGIYLKARTSLIKDVFVNNCVSAEHCGRLQWSDRCFVVGSTFSLPANTKHSLSIRGVDWNSSGSEALVGLDMNTYSEHAVVQNCLFTGNSTAYMAGCAPSNTTTDQRIRKVIFEGCYAAATGANAATGYQFVGTYGCFRNNISVLTGAALYANGYVIQGHAVAPSGNSVFHNNTAFRSDVTASGTTAGVYIGTTSLQGNSVKNTVLYAPSAAVVKTLDGIAGDISATAVGGNVSNVQAKTTNPLFTATTVYSDFTLQSGSPYRNIGVAIGIAPDGLGYTRSATPDIGALNSTANQTSFWTSVLGV